MSMTSPPARARTWMTGATRYLVRTFMAYEQYSVWTRFWHVPVRAERLAVTRILFGLALLTDQLFQYLPHFGEFFGPEGVAPAGLHDRWLLKNWHWRILV